MIEILLYILILLVILDIILTLLKKRGVDLSPKLKEIETSIIKFDGALEKTGTSMKDELQRNRQETHEISRSNREELDKSFKSFETAFTAAFNENIQKLSEVLRQNFQDLASRQAEINKAVTDNVKEIRSAVEAQLKSLQEDNSKQLTEMRQTVDEKLQSTLNARLSQSFETVGKQLQAVQEGLGEMKNLATDVGGLKKVLSNVKMRGGIGEMQLSMLLEQVLAPGQYEANVRTKRESSEQVEFAIRLPGRDDSGSIVWLPIDAKFPKDVYETLLEAYDSADQGRITEAQRSLDATIKGMARDIGSKYLDPPNTTDFGIMFLPFEGIYAEVVRKSALIEELQREHKIIVTGPTTLAAILNSLQMGFRTLAIQKRSGEVWRVLAAVKKEFQNFGGMMEKAQKNIQTGLGQLDEVMGTRTRAIQRKLKDVETITDAEARAILPEVASGEYIDEDEEAGTAGGSDEV